MKPAVLPQLGELVGEIRRSDGLVLRVTTARDERASYLSMQPWRWNADGVFAPLSRDTRIFHRDALRFAALILQAAQMTEEPGTVPSTAQQKE